MSAPASWAVPDVDEQDTLNVRDAPNLDVLHARLEALETRLQKKEIPADPQNLALLKFKMAQAQLYFQNIESNEAQYLLQSPYDETKTDIATILTRAESVARAKGDAVYPATSQMHERAYIAPADGSVQPYWVFVPKDYTPRKKWPLVVFLHGYSPQISKIDPWIPGRSIWEPATTRGFIMAVPYGRRNSDFVSIGEDDTLAVTDAVSARYNVDADRTFLLGPSMGGYGVHNVGLHNPERFAAIAPMCAQTDMYLWFNLRREDVPAWKQVLYDVNDPRHLKLNAFQLPIFMQHGNMDQIVSVEHSRRFYADLKALKYPAFYNEIPYGSHFIYFDDSTFETAFNWMIQLHRAPVPRRVRFSTGSLGNSHSYWIEIDGFRDYSKMAHIDAQTGDANVITVKTENVKRFILKPPTQFLKADMPVTLIVDGVEAGQKYDAALPIQWGFEAPIPGQLQKSPGRAGPIKDCYRNPFMLVYGTLGNNAVAVPGPQPFPGTKNNGDDLDNSPDSLLISDESKARRFLQEWDEFADGRPPIKADKEVTAEDKKNYNLILFGTRATNSVLSEVNDLPMCLAPNAPKNLGLQMCYPSPFDERRMIVIQSGLYWGQELPINHKFDLLPEYIVYSDKIDPTDQTNLSAMAGFFDDNWQLPRFPESGFEPSYKIPSLMIGP